MDPFSHFLLPSLLLSLIYMIDLLNEKDLLSVFIFHQALSISM